MNAPTAGEVPPPGAACAVHPDQEAVAICWRCGNYACRTCVVPRTGVCQDCQERDPVAAFPLDRDSWTLDNVFGHAWRVLNAARFSIIGNIWLLAIPYALIIMAPTLLMVGDLQSGQVDLYSWQTRLRMTAMYVPGLVLGAPFLLGLLAYAVGRAHGKQVGLGVVGQYARRAGHYLLLVVLTWPFFLVTSLLQQTPPAGNPMAALSPSVFVPNLLLSALSMPVLMVQYVGAVELIVEPDISGLDALKAAVRHLTHRPVMALVTAFMMSLVVLGSASCCLLPSIFFMPFSLLAFATLCLAMRTPPSRQG